MPAPKETSNLRPPVRGIFIWLKMNGARIGEGLGCLVPFAILGFFTAAALLVWGIWWLVTHIHFG